MILMLVSALASAADVVIEDDGPHVMADKREYRNLVTPGLIMWPPGAKVRLQRSITDHASVIVGGGLASGHIGGCDCEGLGWARYQVMAGADYHPIGNGMHGPYLGARVLYRHGGAATSLFSQDVSTEHDMLTARGILGYRWIMDPGLSVALGVGAGYRESLRTYSAGESETSVGLQTLVPAAEVNLSWAF